VRDMCLPSKLTSYFAAGRPVVAATAADGGAAEQVRAAGAGLVVPPGRPDALLRAVEEVVDDPVEAAARGDRARRYAAERLSAAAGRDRAVAFVHDLARSRPAQVVGRRT